MGQKLGSPRPRFIGRATGIAPYRRVVAGLALLLLEERRPPRVALHGQRGSLPLPGERRPSRMISTRRGQRPLAGPTVAWVIRPSPQAIIGMSSQVKSRRSWPDRWARLT